MKPCSEPSIDPITRDTTSTPYLQTYEALLRKWPVPYESRLVPTGPGITHVIVSGDARARPLVLLPGMHATALVWRCNVEELSHHFRVYAVDVIGQGGKSTSNTRLRTRQQYAHWLCELLDALNVDKAFLVGSSYGGFLALSQASLRPDRVGAVVMINPAGVFVSVLPLLLPLLWHRLQQMLRFNGASRHHVDIAQYLGRDVVLRPDEQEWARLVTINASKGTRRRNLAFPGVFSTAELRAIRPPVLLLMGDNDLMYDPIATAQSAKRRMPALEVHVLKGAHHIAAMAKPSETNKQIIRFFEKK